MRSKRSHIVRLLGGLALSAILLYLVLRKVEWEPFLEGLAACQWMWVVCSMGCGLLALVLRGLRWRRLLLPVDETTSRRLSIAAYCIGNLWNSALPTSGEWVRCGLATRNKERFDRVLGTAASERIMDLLTLGGILALLALFGWRFIGRFVTQHIIQPVLNFWERPGILLTVLLLLALAAALLFLLRFAAKRFRIVARIKAFLMGVVEGVASIRQMPGKGWFLADTAAIWLLYMLQVMGISMALGLGLLPKDAMLLSALGSIASVIPVPGGMGAYHYIIALTLGSLYGMDWSAGLLFATLCHESQLLVSIVSGIGSWLILPARKS